MSAEERELERLRPASFAIAYRMLGGVSEAEDVVQEALLRVHQAIEHGEQIDCLRAYVATVTTRLAINELRSARARREQYVGELRALLGRTARAVIRRLNPMIRGWANYYRTHVAGEIFGDLDAYLWRLTWKWAVRSHANKPKSWVFARYFGKFNKARQDRWVFGDRQGGSYMHRFAWTNIVRHQTVWQRASPDDPELAGYWARRRSRSVLPINKTSLRLLAAQDGCCPICKAPLFAEQPQTPSDWAAWLTAARTTITIVKPATGTSDEADHRLIQAACSGPALLPAYQPTGPA